MGDAKAGPVCVDFPDLYRSLREVNKMSQERAELLTAQGQWLEREQGLRSELISTKKALDMSQQASGQRDKNVAEQRQLMALGLDKDTGPMKQQLLDMQKTVRERDEELARLRRELAEAKQV